MACFFLGHVAMQLMQHQREFLELSRTTPRYGLFFDCGTGKTIAILSCINADRVKTVVVCPKSIMHSAWVGDAANFPALKTVVCWANHPKDRKKLISTPGADVLIMNPELFKRHQADLIAAGVKRVVVDESSCLKNHKSQMTKATIQFADRMQSVYLLSGTPAPNDETEYWGQLRTIKRGIVSDSFYAFASQYFFPQKRRFRDREVIVGWQLKSHMKDQFYRLLDSVSRTIRKEDAVDLPEQTDIYRVFDLSPDEKEIYTAIEDELIQVVEALHGEPINATNNTLMRLRQATGGAFYDAGRLVSFGSSKLAELVDVLEDIGNKQVVIWAAFTHEIERIASDLFLRDRCAIIDGSVNHIERARRIGDFQDGKLRYLICQPQAAGHGITLTAANYAINYSVVMGSYEVWKQSRDRIHRKGQRWPCTYIHLIAKDTCDWQIIKGVEKKQAIAETLAAILAGHKATEGEHESERCQAVH